jgi:hypothetical protein
LLGSVCAFNLSCLLREPTEAILDASALPFSVDTEAPAMAEVRSATRLWFAGRGPVERKKAKEVGLGILDRIPPAFASLCQSYQAEATKHEI